MWKPGRWVYLEETKEDKKKLEKETETETNSPPSSPPWKLGQVPIETAIFKNGRRISTRFEKLKLNKNSISNSKKSKKKLIQSSSSSSSTSATASATTTTATETATASATTTTATGSLNQKKKFKSIKSQINQQLTQDQSTQTIPQSELQSQSQFQSEPQIQLQPEPQPQPQSEPEPQLQSEPPLQPNASPQSDVQPKSEAQPQSDAESQSPSEDFHITPKSNHQKSLEPISPKTILSSYPNPSVTRELSCDPKETITTTTTDEPPQSLVDTNSITECCSIEPTTPPPTDFSISSSSIHPRRSSAPPLPNHPLQQPPVKKFKPWEALKGIQTDGAEVAGDLKLIQEAHLRHQKKIEISAQQQHTQQKRKLSSTPRVSNAKNTNDSLQPSLPMDRHEAPKSNSQSPSNDHHSISSDLTELSSSLSDLSEEDLSAQRSGSSSMLYSESDLEDDCLPEALVRKVKRPSFSTSSPNLKKNQKENLKWKRRKTALLQHKERKAALRSLVNQPQSSSSDKDLNDSSLVSFQPPPYIKIKTNVYPYRKPELSEFPPAICNCTDGGCGDKCLNRAMFYLCDPKSCRMGQSCTNQPFNLRKDLIDETSSRLGKGLKVFYTGPVKGWGLKTEIKLKKDIFLIDYRGEIISRDVCYKRVLNDYNGCQHFYLMDYDGSDVIDAGKKGNCARFINHSCSPNLRVERFKLSGLEEYQFGIFTLRDIEIGEELSYDYGWRNFSDIAPTSNVRTSIRNKNSKEGRDDEDDEEEEEEENGGTNKKLRRMKRRSNGTTPEVVRATAPTVQRCSCETKGCKGFLGAKKIFVPPPSVPRSTSSKILKKIKPTPSTSALQDKKSSQTAEKKPSTSEKKSTAAAEKKSNQISEKKAGAPEKKSSIAEKKSSIAEKRSSIAEKKSSMAEKRSSIAEKKSSILEKNSVLEKRSTIAEKTPSIAEKKSSILEKRSSIAEKTPSIAEKKSSILEKRSSIAEKRPSIAEKRSSIGEKKSNIAEKESSILEKKSSVGEKRSNIGENRPNVGEKRSSIGEKRSNIGDKRSSIAEKKSNIAEKQANIGEKKASIGEKRSSILEKKSNVGEKKSSRRSNISCTSTIAPPPPTTTATTTTTNSNDNNNNSSSSSSKSNLIKSTTPTKLPGTSNSNTTTNSASNSNSNTSKAVPLKRKRN